MSDRQPASANRAVFLSYASQDAEAVERIAVALRAAGVEVWFDKSELTGGDAWDAKIRKQIAECGLFVPVISTNTQARTEGYFRLEWKLAAQRTHMIADDAAFLVPVVIDETRDSDARVPVEFKAVQWTRLPGGETPEKFCARVKKLLGGEVAPVGAVPDRPLNRQPDRQSEKRATRRGFAQAILGVAAVAALALWQPWRAKEKAAPPISPTAATAPTASITEAQQLVGKARKILDEGDEMNRETYTLAEELLKKAEALDVTEASAWALHAQLSADMLLFGLDYLPARAESVQAQASRAVKLAPDSLEAAVAMAEAQNRAAQDLDGVLQRMQALAEKNPNDWRVWRTLGHSALNASKIELGVSAVDRALQLLPDDPRLKSDRFNLLYRGAHFAEAESWMVQALEGRTSARLEAFDILLKLTWRGDLAGATAAVQRLPAWFLSEDRGCSLASLAYLWAHEPKKTLELVSHFPRDYIRNNYFYGPRAVLTAWAHEAGGESESAKAAWQVVLQVTDRELNGAPDDSAALHWKAWALARLGQTDEANRLLRLLSERNLSVTLGRGGLDALLGNLAGLAAAVGRADIAVAQIENSLKGKALYQGRAAFTTTRSTLRLNPVFDPLRGDPRFQALIEVAPGPEEKKENATAGATALDPKSVAVLAFANLSDDKANEYFSDGISEELLNVLAKVPKLRVAARTSSFYFKGQNVPIPEIAQKLGVAYVVEGSVRKAGDKVRITAQLIKAADGFHVWSETYDRELKDIFAVQDEIAKNILQAVKGSLLGVAELPHTTTTTIEAYTLFLQAQGALAKRGDANLRKAIGLFDSALAIDPNYVPALIGQAQAHSLLPVYAVLSGAKAREEVDAAAKTAKHALELEPRNAPAHTVIGYLLWQYDWRWNEGLTELLRARDLAPGDSWIWNMLGDYYRFVGDLTSALPAKQRAWELDPLSAFTHWDLAWVYLNAGKNDLAMQWAEKSLALAPNIVDGYFPVISVASQAGRPELMRQTIAKARQNTRDGEGLLLLLEARAAMLEHKPEEAHRKLSALEPMAERGDFSPGYVGYSYLLLGDTEKATHWLRRASDESDISLMDNTLIDLDVIAANPATRPILEQPRLKELYELRRENARTGRNKL